MIVSGKKVAEPLHAGGWNRVLLHPRPVAAFSAIYLLPSLHADSVLGCSLPANPHCLKR